MLHRQARTRIAIGLVGLLLQASCAGPPAAESPAAGSATGPTTPVRPVLPTPAAVEPMASPVVAALPPAPGPTAGADAPAAARGTMRRAVDEHFADNRLGWPSDAGGAIQLAGGAYRLAVRERGRFVAVRAPIAQPLRDVVVSATFRKLGGPPGGGYGIVVRDQGAPAEGRVDQAGGFYVCEVSDRGEVGVWRRDGDRWVELVPWTPAETVRPGEVPNELIVMAIGDRLTCIVNDKLVANTTISGHPDGGVGLFVGGDQNEVAVERFAIDAPETVAAALSATAAPNVTADGAVTQATVVSATARSGAASEAGSPDATAGASAVAPVLQSVLDERFGDDWGDWPSDPGGPARLANGAYRVAAREPGRFVLVRAPVSQPLRDVTVTAVFRKISGPPGGGYGIVLRDQGPARASVAEQSGRFYVLEVGDRGEVGAWRRDGEHWVELLPWTPAAAVKPGLEPNELTGRAIGDRLTFLVNGTLVFESTDTTLADGAVGLFIGGDANEVAVERFAVQASVRP